jgi:hypothetical protein
MLPHTENNIATPTPNDMDHYRLVREIASELNSVLAGKIPRSGLKECAKKLGLWKHGGIDVAEDGRVDVFFDYCIHQFRINNASVIERHLLMSPPVVDSIEFSILQTMLKSYYSIYTVIGTVKNKGIRALDLMYQREMFIIDISMSNTARLGLVFAGNIMPLNEFYITSGASLPIPHELLENKLLTLVDDAMGNNLDAMLPKSKEAFFAAQVIKEILKYNIWSEFKYKDTTGE